MKNLKKVSKTLFLNSFIKHLNFFPIIIFLQPIKILSGEQLYHVRCFLRKYDISINRIKGSFLKLSLLKFYEQKNLSTLKVGAAFFITNINFFSLFESLKILRYIDIFFVPFFFKINNSIISPYVYNSFFDILKRNNLSIYFFFTFSFFFFIFSINFFLNFLLYRKMFSEFFFVK